MPSHIRSISRYFIVLAINIVALLAFSSLLASGATLKKIFLPIVIKSDATPLESYSYYISSKDATEMSKLGCDLGYKLREKFGSYVTVLFFGAPHYDDSPGGTGEQGTRLLNYNNTIYISTTEVAQLVRKFTTEYTVCSLFSSAKLTVILAPSMSDISKDSNNKYVTPYHGQIWASMVADIVHNNPNSGRIVYAGGANMEVKMNSPAVTNRWLDGFLSYSHPTDGNQGIFFYNLGDAQGCNWETNPNPTNNLPCDEHWYQDDIWNISWRNERVRPIPLNYNSDIRAPQAHQWFNIYNRGVSLHGHIDDPLPGVMVQSRACAQLRNCFGDDNTPKAGYDQMLEVFGAMLNFNWVTNVGWDYCSLHGPGYFDCFSY